MNVKNRLQSFLGRAEFSPLGFLLVLIWILVVFTIGTEPGIYIQFLLATCLLFVLPGYFLARKIKVIRVWHENWERLALSLVLGASFLLLLVFPLSFFAVPIPKLVLWIYGLTMSGLGLWVLFKDLRHAYQLNQSSTRPHRLEAWVGALAVWLTFAALLYIHIMPTKGLLVAPLHDPAQNSLMATRLMENDLLHASLPKFSNWYPPGAAYLAALIGSLANISGPKMVLIQTNFFNLMITFSIALLAKRMFVERSGGWVAFCTYGLLSYSVASYYFLAGKNSQVIANFWFFCALYFLIGEFWRRSSFGILVSVAVVGATVMMHVTQAPILVYLILLIGVWYCFVHGWQASTKRIINNFPIIALSVALVGASVFIEFYVFISDYLGQRFTQVAINSTPDDISRGSRNFLNLILSMKDPFFGEKTITQNLAILGIVGTGYWIFSHRWRTLRPWLIVTLFLILSIILHFFTVKIFANMLLSPAITLAAAMGCVFIWQILRKWRWISVVLFVALLVPGVENLKKRYKKYKIAGEDVSVIADDRKAYDWIVHNTSPDDAFFTIDIFNKDLKKSENITSGGVLYLKHFTGREDVLGFVGGDRFSHEEIEYRDMLFKLRKDYRNMEILETLDKAGIRYIYTSSRERAKPLVKNSDLYTPVFSEGRLVIYKINVTGR